ncbi:MAG: 50S ribosomal protein L27 [Candidatus Blackburnbacteria bacterium RIFCSPHIGHO2_02_FULL_39_13]|uniref:Large ribosomal subunit protein bL27 n=1 Tax=Candidatus Blackburnbacteria bacterium RIFCSPLOWO2_01_FULL_40_20 TaxID=1797519 RepID=A0A1G1VED9_9BACT|nr:MAG: 50S ribosomal protein L27 [Microgenomates group bacterium GW2011_GWA2_39_19]OGY06910.1 MAG: 50S ribosomal protein L27 [Candidatus Blackburnbacteria bacterium RIFCSPHIGHO2_01_FULL_40_17]OGY09200.1 MAG: 50S ribosomal protein L27 [Candidatus Blackburnbacteria bacterium RIFCSPHIGHO2_02_FULL_39_13]OGY13562.1 MAG: 50S ribosomal protein L27 [Candidatus Blackburnbacteria bacterium RIFCSPLOWO2_01_FULL_40_20]HBL52214.1 50S ribosomal protein L27 [Candidatus Blackburnbacteria bacterium]
MSKKKAAGKVRQHAQRPGKRLGVKVSGGEKVGSGNILVRQRGTKFAAGDNVKVGRDHALYAVKQGVVEFKTKYGKQIVGVKTI